ncbi:hypothetical protein FWF93_03280 [Candidatus Saccharibacteria bacterium]|nr:hypothetical protein [Candidatus Saccharibacteria bacterium]
MANFNQGPSGGNTPPQDDVLNSAEQAPSRPSARELVGQLAELRDTSPDAYQVAIDFLNKTLAAGKTAVESSGVVDQPDIFGAQTSEEVIESGADYEDEVGGAPVSVPKEGGSQEGATAAPENAANQQRDEELSPQETLQLAGRELAEATFKLKGGRRANQTNLEAYETARDNFANARSELIKQDLHEYRVARLRANPNLTPKELEQACSKRMFDLLNESERTKNTLICDRMDGNGRGGKFVRSLGRGTKNVLKVTGMVVGGAGLVAFGGIIGIGALGYLIHRHNKNKRDPNRATQDPRAQYGALSKNSDFFSSGMQNIGAEGQEDYRRAWDKALMSGVNSEQEATINALGDWVDEQSKRQALLKKKKKRGR